MSAEPEITTCNVSPAPCVYTDSNVMPCFLKRPARAPRSGAAVSQFPRMGMASFKASSAEMGVDAVTMRAISPAVATLRNISPSRQADDAALSSRRPADQHPPFRPRHDDASESRRQVGDHGVEHGKAGERHPQHAARRRLDCAFLAQYR